MTVVRLLAVVPLLALAGARPLAAQDPATAPDRAAVERSVRRAEQMARAVRQAKTAAQVESITNEAVGRALQAAGADDATRREAARRIREAAQEAAQEAAHEAAEEARQEARHEAGAERLEDDWELIGRDPQGLELPDLDGVPRGDRTVAVGETARGTVAAAGGNLEVFGRVEGTAVAVRGDVILHPGAVVTGDALAVGREVRFEGGSLTGEARSLSAPAADAPADAPRGAIASTWAALRLALGWAAMVGVLGIAVLVFAEQHLEGVHATLHRRFWRSFWVGALAEAALLPVLVLVVVALAITIVGILAIPLAIAAYVLAVAGLATLGFLAMARVIGATVRGPRGGERYVALRSLTWGLSLFAGLWLLAAAFTAVPVLSTVLALVAGAITWAAATAGFGAAIISRAGTRPPASLTPTPAEELAWQTPTPVAGVAAARRPTPVRPSGPR